MRRDVTPLEWWLLDAVVEHGVPHCELVGSRHGEVLNRRPHGATRRELALALERLYRRGWILARSHDGPPRSLGLAGIERAFSEYDPEAVLASPRTWYVLAAAGGAVWEEMSMAQWDRRVDWRCWGREGARGRAGCAIEGGDPGLVERALRYIATECEDGGAIDRASILRLELRGWEATYWKLLPIGYRVTFVGDPASGYFGRPFGRSRDPEFACGVPRWRTDPFALR